MLENYKILRKIIRKLPTTMYKLVHTLHYLMYSFFSYCNHIQRFLTFIPKNVFYTKKRIIQREQLWENGTVH